MLPPRTAGRDRSHPGHRGSGSSPGLSSWEGEQEIAAKREKVEA